jgi:hypothetical protein
MTVDTAAPPGYWVSTPTSHHSHNLKRDNRLSAMIFDFTVPPGPDQQAVYVAGTALEVPLPSPSTCPERSVQSVVPARR